jgi:sugar/nucleoside kinase (ribokinase family)
VSDSVAKGRVVVVGDALIDEIHSDGEVREFVGGAALNVAVGLSILGVRTTLIAMVGDDKDGATIRSFLAEHGVELIPTIGPNGSSRGVSDRLDGEPFYVFNAAAQARRIQFGEAEKQALAEASLVVVSCFPFDDVAQSEELMAAVPDAASKLVVDPNPRSSMMHDTARFLETFERIAPKALLIKVGDDDAKLLGNRSIAEFAEHLRSIGATAVLATAGKDGASVETTSGEDASSPIQQLPGPIVDTMGAGDATLASVVTSILAHGFPASNADWSDVLEQAMLIAAATCRHEGALLRQP